MSSAREPIVPASTETSTTASQASGTPRGMALLIAVATGVFIAADDQTSIVAVLPAIVSDIGLTIDDFYRSSWVVNGYLLGYLVALPIVGRIADVYGRTRVYAASLALFMLGSALVAIAPTFETLVAARAVQAVGGGAVVPVAMAIVVDELPPARRVMGLGAIAAASEAGALLGPLWGGGITEWLGWRAVFWANLPMALPVMLAVWRLSGSRSAERSRGAGAIDWIGAVLLVVALTLLTFALVDDPNAPRPLLATGGLLSLAAATGVAFAWRERRLAASGGAPMVQPGMFAHRAVLAANLTSFLVGAGLITALIGVPLFVNLVLLGSPLDGGLTLMRFTVGVPLGALAGGWLGSRLGLRVTAVAGMALAAAGFAGLQAWDHDPSEVMRTLPLLGGGFGFGLVITPLGAAVLRHAGEAERASASAWLTLSRVAGMLVGAALLTATGLGRFYARAGTIEFDSPEFEALVAQAQVETFREVFIVAMVVMAAGALVAWLIGRGAREDDRDAAVDPWWTVT